MATVTMEDQETLEQGLSGHHVLVDMCDGSALTAPLKYSTRIKYTCIAVGKKYVALGANTGAVYMFDRLTQQHIQVVDSHQPRTEVIKVAFSPDENILCVVSSSGLVSVIEHNTECHKKSEQVRLSSLHKGARITSLVAKETRFFLGDENGKVTALSGSREFFKLPSEVIMKLDSAIVQLDVHNDMILVSTETRCYLGNTNKQQFTQVGKKLREIPLGACFLHPRHLTSPVVYCARPGSRLWEVDQSGSVLNTHMFKQLLDVPPLEAIQIESEDHTFHTDSPGPQSVGFTTLHPLGGQYLLSICDKGLYILHTSKVTLLLWNGAIKRADLTDFAAYKSELYLLYPGNKICHMTLMSVPKLVKNLFERDNFRLCAQMVLAFSETMLEEKTSKKYNINAIMGMTLREHLKGQGHLELAEKLNSLIDKLDKTGLEEWMKDVSFNNNTGWEGQGQGPSGNSGFNRTDSGMFVMRNRTASFDSSGSFSEADIEDLKERMGNVPTESQGHEDTNGKNWNIKQKAQSTLFGIRDKLKQKLLKKESESETGVKSETVTKSDTGVKSDTGAKSETGAKCETIVKCETGAKSETCAKSETGVKNETVVKSETDSSNIDGSERIGNQNACHEIEIKDDTKLPEGGHVVYYNKNNNSGTEGGVSVKIEVLDVGQSTESKASSESIKHTENTNNPPIDEGTDISSEMTAVNGVDIVTHEEMSSHSRSCQEVDKLAPDEKLQRKGSRESLTSLQSQTSLSHHSVSSEDAGNLPPAAPEPQYKKPSETKPRSGKKKRVSIVSFDETSGEGNLPMKSRKEGSSRKKKKPSLKKRRDSTESTEDIGSVDSKQLASEDIPVPKDDKVTNTKQANTSTHTESVKATSLRKPDHVEIETRLAENGNEVSGSDEVFRENTAEVPGSESSVKTETEFERLSVDRSVECLETNEISGDKPFEYSTTNEIAQDTKEPCQSVNKSHAPSNKDTEGTVAKIEVKELLAEGQDSTNVNKLSEYSSAKQQEIKMSVECRSTEMENSKVAMESVDCGTETLAQDTDNGCQDDKLSIDAEIEARSEDDVIGTEVEDDVNLRKDAKGEGETPDLKPSGISRLSIQERVNDGHLNQLSNEDGMEVKAGSPLEKDDENRENKNAGVNAVECGTKSTVVNDSQIKVSDNKELISASDLDEDENPSPSLIRETSNTDVVTVTDYKISNKDSSAELPHERQSVETEGKEVCGHLEVEMEKTNSDESGLNETQEGLLSTEEVGDNRGKQTDGKENRSRGVSPGRIGRKALESVNTVKDRLSTKAWSLMRTIKDTKEWVTTPKEVQPPLDVAPKLQVNGENGEDLPDNTSVKEEIPADDSDNEENSVALDTSHLEVATRKAMEQLDGGKDKESVCKAWVMHINQATSLLKTLLVGSVIDGRCTCCHRIRNEPVPTETSELGDLNDKTSLNENLKIASGSNVSIELEKVNGTDIMKYSTPKIGDICDCEFTDVESNALAESINGANFTEMCLLNDPFDFSETICKDISYLVTECLTRGYYGDNINILKVAKLGQTICADNVEAGLQFYEEDEMVVFMKCYLYCLDLRQVHRHVVAMDDHTRRKHVWKTLSRGLKVMSYEEEEFSGHLVCHNMSDIGAALNTLTRPECMLGCILRLCSDNLSIGLDHLRVAMDAGHLTAVDMLYICDAQTSSESSVTESETKSQSTKVSEGTDDRGTDRTVDTKRQGSDNLYKLLKSFTLTQIGKDSGNIDRLHSLSCLCCDTEVYLHVLQSFLDQGVPSSDTSCVCGRLPRPYAHRLPWLHSHVISDLLRLHSELDKEKCDLCVHYGFWLGVLSMQSRSPAVRTDALTVAMQLADPQLLVSVQLGILPLTEDEAEQILKIKEKQDGHHSNQSHSKSSHHSKTEDQFSESQHQEETRGSLKHPMSQPVQTGSQPVQTSLDLFDSDEEESDCPVFIMSDNQRNLDNNSENDNDIAETEKESTNCVKHNMVCLHCHQEILPCKLEAKDDFINRLNASMPHDLLELGQGQSHASHMTLVNQGQGHLVTTSPVSPSSSPTRSWLSIFGSGKNKGQSLKDSQNEVESEIKNDSSEQEVMSQEVTSEEVGIPWEVLVDILVQQFGTQRGFTLLQCVDLPLGALPTSFFLRCLVEETSAVQHGKFYQAEVSEIEAKLWENK